jgi:type VI protein secretion system component VasK
LSRAKRVLAFILALGWVAVCSDQTGYITGRYAISGFPLILLVIGYLAIAFAPLLWVLRSVWRRRREAPLQHLVSQRARNSQPIEVDELVAPLTDGDQAWIEFLRIRGVGQSSLDPS